MALSRKILLVDDHFVARGGVRAMLEYAGHTIVGAAANGLEALDLLDKNRVDLIVADLSMPKMSGHELIRIVVKRFVQAKIIVLSSHSDDKSVAAAIQDDIAPASLMPSSRSWPCFASLYFKRVSESSGKYR